MSRTQFLNDFFYLLFLLICLCFHFFISETGGAHAGTAFMADPLSLFYIPAVGRITSHVLFNSMLLQHRRLSAWTIFTAPLFTGKLPGWVKKHQEGISWNLSQHFINGHPQNCVSNLWSSLLGCSVWVRMKAFLLSSINVNGERCQVRNPASWTDVVIKWMWRRERMELHCITSVESLLHQGSFAEMDLHEIRCVLHGNVRHTHTHTALCSRWIIEQSRI